MMKIENDCLYKSKVDQWKTQLLKIMSQTILVHEKKGNRSRFQLFTLYDIQFIHSSRLLKGIDYLQVLFFIIEPRGLKFGMRM